MLRQTSKLLNARHKNVKLYWRLLKGGNCNKNPQNISIDIITRYFKSINEPNNTFFQAGVDIIFFNERIAQNELEILFTKLDLPFTEDDIKRGLTSIHNCKSADPDLLINKFLIIGKHFLSYLTLLLSKIFEIGYFPEQ